MNNRKMKDSKIAWIGEIPSHWNVLPQKYIMYKKKELCEKYSGENILSLTLNGVIKRDLENPSGKMPATFDGYQKVQKGNLLLCLFDIDVTPRCVGLINDDGLTSPAYSHFAMKNNNNARYYDYLLRMIDNDKCFLHLSKNLRSSLTETDFGMIKSIVPPLDEQEKIANYLDSKIFEINSIINNTKKTIEEYKKYKHIHITELVTKGLNKDAKMKDSGVEWIGNIPYEWELTKLKKIIKTPLQYGANSSGIPYDEKLPRYIRITDIDSNNNLKTDGKLSLSDDESKQFILKEGDILFARSGGTVGKTFLYKESYGISAFAGYLIKASIKDEFLPEFIYYYTLSSAYNEWKNRIFIQATIQNIGANKYSNMEIAIPKDKNEQREIVKYLDKRCLEIDNLILQKQNLIDELENYKKSLIYECVTGKKEI